MLIAFQQQVTVITIHMCKNDGLENFFFFFVFSHPGDSVSLPGVRESGCISRRLPDDPGGFTCMLTDDNSDAGAVPNWHDTIAHYQTFVMGQIFKQLHDKT